MAIWTQARKRRLILDIGASAVRVCELDVTKTGYQLAKYYQTEYNSDPGLNEEERRRERVRALEEVLKAAKVRTKRTIFAVPGQSVFTRSRALPPVPEFKVTQIVRYEIQQQIPFSLDQIAMDYQVLSRSEGGGYDVMMAAIKVDVVEKHLDLLRETKRSIDVVDVCPFSAYNWLKHTGEFGDSGECVALIDIGASTTDIVIERENQFRFTRPLNVGGNDVTLAIAAAFGLNFTDAERVKRQRGFAPTGDEKADGRGAQVVGEVLQRLVMEINRSFGYFRSLPGGGNVNRVVLCGGGACLRNIVPYMQRQLGIEVRIAQPLAGLAVSPQAQAASENPEQACVVLGLALRCRQPVPIEINLIPPRVQEAARRREQAFYWSLIFTTFALILASIIPITAKENEAVLAKIRKIQLVLEQYDPTYRDNLERSFQQSDVVQELRRARAIVQEPMNEQAQLSTLFSSRRVWIDALKMINEQRPTASKLWLTHFESIYVERGGQGQQQQPGRRVLGGARAAQRTEAGRDDFPGIEPPAAGTRQPQPGGRRVMRGPGGAPQGQGQGQDEFAPIDYSIPTAGGLRIAGYADSPTTIREYVENLNRSWIQHPDRSFLWVEEVRFKDGDVQRRSESALWSRDNPSPADYEQNIIYDFKVDLVLGRGAQLPARITGGGEASGAGASGEGAQP
jgi:type IV pilus assembly protein PilM